jgi:pyruvate,orthophosphate dikinase
MALRQLEDNIGRRLGDRHDPLLVSVRSGAAFSMPGMMETVLNIGLNDASVKGLAEESGDERFAWDSYRRLVQMFGNSVGDTRRGVLRCAGQGEVDQGCVQRCRPRC